MPIAAVVGLLPTILQSLGVVYHDFGGKNDDQVTKIIGIASQALAGVPEAISAFVKLKDTLGGRAPTLEDLLSLKAEIHAQGEKISELAAQAHEA